MARIDRHRAAYRSLAQGFARRVATPLRNAWTRATLLLVVVGLVLIARHGADAGVIWDEVFHLTYGDLVLAWFRSGFQDARALSYWNLFLYGGLFDMTAQWIAERSTRDAYETRHIVTAVTALLGVIGTHRLAARVAGRRAGFFAALMLALTPAWLGHGLFNPKDIPFGTAAVWAVHGAVCLGMGPLPLRARDVLWAGVTLGLALAIRPGGVVLIAYPLLAVFGRVLLELIRRRERHAPLQLSRTLLGALGRLAPAYALAWLLMLSTWPWAQLAPLSRPIEAVRAALHFKWPGQVLFRGQLIFGRDLPRSYLPTWFAMTLPETYLLALACALLALIRRVYSRAPLRTERAIGLALIATSAALPLALALAVRPIIYDGLRHFLFVLPPLAALSGIALASVSRASAWPVWVRGPVLAAFFGLCMLTAGDIAELHPYEYVYFNRSSGGLASAYGNYETDYWGASYREGLTWVLDHLADVQPGKRIRVAACNPNANDRLKHYVKTWPRAQGRIVVARGYKDAHIFLAVTRERCHHVAGEVLHKIERQHVPLLFVIRTGRRW